jgi:hypothetical protein
MGAVAASLAIGAITLRVPALDLAASMLPAAYLAAIVVGVPAYLMSRSYMPVPFWTYPVAGLIASSFVAVPVAAFFGMLAFAAVGLFAGLVAGLTFGLIVGTKSNHRLERP